MTDPDDAISEVEASAAAELARALEKGRWGNVHGERPERALEVAAILRDKDAELGELRQQAILDELLASQARDGRDIDAVSSYRKLKWALPMVAVAAISLLILLPRLSPENEPPQAMAPTPVEDEEEASMRQSTGASSATVPALSQGPETLAVLNAQLQAASTRNTDAHVTP